MPYDSEEYERLSTEETLNRSGYSSLAEVQKDALYGRQPGVPAQCECGRRVEPDGKCPHGNPSVLLGNALI